MNETDRVREWRKKNRKECPDCLGLMAYTSKTCKNCRERKKSKQNMMDTTLGDLRERESVKGKHPSWVTSIVRQFARSWYRKEIQEAVCERCGYALHVELCHKKPVASFDDDATLIEINASSNIVFLCPNCHWEFDHAPDVNG